MTPHKVLETVTVNSVRRQVTEYIFSKCELSYRFCPMQILVLTKPLAEIARQIDISIETIEDQKKEVETTEASAEDIFQRINITVESLGFKSCWLYDFSIFYVLFRSPPLRDGLCPILAQSAQVRIARRRTWWADSRSRGSSRIAIPLAA